VPTSTLVACITSQMDVEDIEVTDTSAGCGVMYKITVVSEEFEGVSRIQRHKMVHDVLGENMRILHGVTIEASTPSENDDL